jgi:WD40 repeat protein
MEGGQCPGVACLFFAVILMHSRFFRFVAAGAVLLFCTLAAPLRAQNWKTMRATWEAPSPRYFASGDGKFLLKVIPGGAGALGVMTALQEDGQERELWRRDLGYVPVDVLVTGRAAPYVVAFDTWGRPGAQHSLVIISPAGELVRDFSLEQLLSAEEIATRVAATGNNRWWREGAQPTLLGGESPVLRIDFPWGKTLIVDLAAGRLPLFGELRETGPLQALALSRDGAILATGGDTPPLKLWNAATTTLRLSLDTAAEDAQGLVFSPLNSLLASLRGGEVTLWDAETGTARPFAIKPVHPISSVAFSPDGRLLATGLAPGRFHAGDGLIEGEVKLWDVQSGAPRLTLRWQDNEPAPGAKATPTDITNAVAFSADGALVAGGTWRGLQLWDAAAGDLKRTLLAPSPVTDGTLQLHDGTSGALRGTLQGFNGQGSVTFSPNSLWLAVTGRNNEVRVWDTRTLRLKSALRGHVGFVTALAFDSDNNTLYSASEDGTVKIWKVE